jgi:hypothetical protein
VGPQVQDVNIKQYKTMPPKRIKQENENLTHFLTIFDFSF